MPVNVSGPTSRTSFRPCLAHPSFEGTGFSRPGLTLGTCTGIWILGTSVNDAGFVAEMRMITPIQANCGKHLDSSAGSRPVVHRPYWRGTLLYWGGLGTPVHRPALNGTFCTRGRREGRRDVPVSAGDGLNPGPRVVATRLDSSTIGVAMVSMLLDVGE